MTKKEVLEKVAFLGGMGFSIGKGLTKMAPTMGPKLIGMAGKNPRLFSGAAGAAGGALVGGVAGALKNPGMDENGRQRSRFGNILGGAGIGGLTGGVLGSSLGKNFGKGVNVGGRRQIGLNAPIKKPILKTPSNPATTKAPVLTNTNSILGGKGTATQNTNILTEVRAAKAGKPIQTPSQTSGAIFKDKPNILDKVQAKVTGKKIYESNFNLDPSLGDSFKVKEKFNLPYKNMNMSDKKLYQGRNKFK